MGSLNLFSLFSCIVFAMMTLISATHDISPPRLASLLAPQASPVGVDCMNLMYDMASCISFLTVGSKEMKPTPECCLGLVTVLKTDAECVCEALKITTNLGFDIDMERAMALPSGCNTKATSIDSCHMSDTPGTSPVSAPGNSRVAVPDNFLAPTPIFLNSPAPAPNSNPVSSKSPAPVPYASLESPKSPAQVPLASPLFSKIPARVSPSPSTPAPVAAHQGVAHHAPALEPKADAYALVSSSAFCFSMLAASFLFVFA